MNRKNELFIEYSIVTKNWNKLLLKNDSEYTLEYFLRCSGWGPLEKKTEKRLRIIYLENDYPLLVTLENCLRKAQTKIQTGDMGYRSPHLSHAKRALYHLSYIPWLLIFYRMLQKPINGLLTVFWMELKSNLKNGDWSTSMELYHIKIKFVKKQI